MKDAKKVLAGENDMSGLDAGNKDTPVLGPSTPDSLGSKDTPVLEPGTGAAPLPEDQLGKDSPDLLEGGATLPETGKAGPADDAATAPVVPMFGFRRKTSMGF